jgi:hypothetical protein
MRPRTLLVLLALVAGLGAFIWFYERDLPGSEEREKQSKKVFQGLEIDQVSAVGIEWDGQKVRLERVGPAKPPEEKAEKKGADEAEGTEPALDPAGDDSEWRIVEPLATRADAGAVSALLQALLDLEQTRTIEDPDPQALGLDKPQVTVRLTTPEGEKALLLGTKIPTSAAVAAGFSGEDEAYVVSDSVLTELRREPGEWRDRQVVHGDRATIERIVLVAGPVQTVLQRQGDAFWVHGAGGAAQKDLADRDLVDGLLGDLTGLRVQRFMDAPGGEDPGLTPPAALIQLEQKGEPPLRLELGKPVLPPGETAAPGATALYARANGQLFELQTTLAANAGRPTAEWRAPTLAGLQVHEVNTARVRDAKGEVVLTRAEADWKRGDDLIPFTPVSDFLFALTDARADRLLTPDEAAQLSLPLAKAVLSVTLAGDAGKETLTLYPPVAAGVPARVAGRPTVLLLPHATWQSLRGHLAEIRAAQPVSKEEGEGEKKEE